MKRLSYRFWHSDRDGLLRNACWWSGYDCQLILHVIGLRDEAISDCSPLTRQQSDSASAKGAGGRERPPNARRGFGTPNGVQNGVAPGHGTDFAASLSLFRLDGNSAQIRRLEPTAGGTESGTIARTCIATDRSAFGVLVLLGEALKKAETMG